MDLMKLLPLADDIIELIDHHHSEITGDRSVLCDKGKRGANLLAGAIRGALATATETTITKAMEQQQQTGGQATGNE